MTVDGVIFVGCCNILPNHVGFRGPPSVRFAIPGFVGKEYSAIRFVAVETVELAHIGLLGLVSGYNIQVAVIMPLISIGFGATEYIRRCH